ncbi:RHS repeat domain-containing protein, partial [Flavobacterium sp. UBA4197]|uniref:RHS repeat domain-containing protein n=1 Tax=Flavobacterium sp. UBA4197 TaxID=1946546 RepID=UPI00257B381F
ELTNHLGNVLVVINDKKIPEFNILDTPGSGLKAFNADVLTYSDYYPFGMIIDARHRSKTDYRYGFQGQEMDNEIKGEGNPLNYTFRMHDPRVGRFFAVDPLTKKYPFYSPYAFSGNRVLDAVELEGLEPEEIVDKSGKITKPIIGLLTGAFLFDKTRIQNTNWVSASNPNLTTAQKIHYVFTTGKPQATSFYNSVIYADSEKPKGQKYWIGLVAHEQSHQDDARKQGNNSFYFTYVGDGINYSYRSIPTEEMAFRIEEKYVPLLLKYKNGTVMDILNSKDNFTENQKAMSLEKIGAEFRMNVILEGEIQNNRKEIKYYKNTVTKMRTEARRRGENENSTKVLLFEAFTRDLEKENKNLKNEQNEIKKTYSL